MESIESAYQKILFSRDVESEDTCLTLDNTVQICASYRPHYHEMVVHNTARFLDKIKRVVFVGGGDSMLLHEIVKYPSLELVVGLELDQKVTRNSFKYFGTQPHYDNEKVQWWYGDASKSLLMVSEQRKRIPFGVVKKFHCQTCFRVLYIFKMTNTIFVSYSSLMTILEALIWFWLIYRKQ